MGQRRRPPNAAAQALGLKARFGGSTVLRPGRLRWRGHLQPTANSREFDVEVEYRLGWHPRVRVIAPELEPNDAGLLPHFYPDSQTLCLYERHDWSQFMLLANTIVPWTTEWLFHYEIWKITGLWHGTGDDMAWANNPGAQPLEAA